MKKIVLLIGAAMILYVIVTVLAAGGTGTEGGVLTGGEGAHKVVYVVREKDDRVVVYRDDSLFLTTDTPVSLLPKSDRSRLEKGIVLYSDEELKTLIEDICS